MIDTELQEVARQSLDRPLEGLEADIWMSLERRERATYISRRLLWVQTAVLLFALAGSLLIGRELVRRQAPDSLAVFYDPLPLSPLGVLGSSP